MFVFQAGTPLVPSNLRRLISVLAVEAGIEGEVGPYDMRHTRPRRCYQQPVTQQSAWPICWARMVHKHYRHPVTTSISVAADYWSAAQGAHHAPNMVF